MANNQFNYRARRAAGQVKTLLEEYGERYIVSFFRFNMPEMQRNDSTRVQANYDYGPMIEQAAKLNETIDMFDNNPGMLDQLIFGIQYPDLCHPGVKEFVDDKRLVALLLVRSFKKTGGLVLPPLDGTQELADAHANRMRADKAAGRAYTMMHYPNWHQARTAPQQGANQPARDPSASPGQGGQGVIGTGRRGGGN